MILNSGARLTLALCVAGLLSWAAFWSARLSYADWLYRRNTADSVGRAVALDPRNGHYHAWLGELLENAGQDSSAAFAAAARLSPFDSTIWIRQGLNAELAGNRAEAERLLLHAAAIDKLLEPRWTLMNFYFRAGDEADFWTWARQSFAISYGDRTPLFDLCWRFREDAGLIAAKALPPDYAVRMQFMRFLLAKGQPEQAAVIAEQIVASAPASDVSEFTACVQQLLENGHPQAATRVWNGLCAARLLPFERLDPSRGSAVTNPNFVQYPSGIGFDWHISSNPEVTTVKTADGLRISLSGKQGDESGLLSQTIPLEPGRNYRLRFSFITSGVTVSSGLRLQVLDEVTPELAAVDWHEQSLTFSSGAHQTALIDLAYRRPLGRIPLDGSVTLRNFSLDPVP